ncbi:uncharacterized protein Dwil_GK28195 [Drosophila willistoni]|uniref:Uncharacterized protein n=1 Tax=Drosophila willistoni TaxID=7260 RepID=A0A0Q9X2Y9_DROWI|nr:uncharacterized protein Dwil_GK28195 [Drosophila willistoni]
MSNHRCSTQHDWLERNSRPKPIFRSPCAPEPTRWQKPGPMNRDEWVNFYKWCLVNAVPQFPAQNPGQSYNRLSSGYGKSFNSTKNEKRKKHLEEVASALSQPRWQRNKYHAPPKPEFPYRPNLGYYKAPKPERGRPVEKPKVPCCFQHDDIKAEFWSTIRFPVSKRAQHAVPSRKICELSRPRTAKPHCPFPEIRNDKPPRRTKMSSRQWRAHLQRLDYLAKPSPRALAELACNCRICCDCH